MGFGLRRTASVRRGSASVGPAVTGRAEGMKEPMSGMGVGWWTLRCRVRSMFEHNSRAMRRSPHQLVPVTARVLPRRTAVEWKPRLTGMRVNPRLATRDSAAEAGGCLENVLHLASGGGFSCAVRMNGSVWCWGYNDQGIFGSRDTIALTAVAIAGLAGATGIAAGSAHACALVSGGSVWCWGSGALGALGDGQIVRDHRRAVPAPAMGLRAVTALAAGESRTCALLAGGSVSCWGMHAGDGEYQGPGVPTPVQTLSNVRAISSGPRHTCVVLASGSVQCWGGNYYGELGRGEINEAPLESGAPELFPRAVVDLSDARLVSAGGSHNCAIVGPDGNVRCWGANGSGQLGDGTTASAPQPVIVNGLSRTKDLAAGGAHTCALLEDGSVRCWGSNGFGQLGNGQSPEALSFSAVPVPVKLAGVTAISRGGSHTCAVLSDRTARCWGANQVGQLGSGKVSGFSAVPIRVTATGDQRLWSPRARNPERVD